MDSWDSPSWSSSWSQDDRSPTWHEEYRADESRDPSSLDPFEQHVYSLLTDYQSASDVQAMLKNHEIPASSRKKMQDFSLVSPRNLWADLILASYALNAIFTFFQIPVFIMIIFLLFKLPVHHSISAFFHPLLHLDGFRLVLLLLLALIILEFITCYCGYLFYRMIHRDNLDFIRIHFGYLPTVNYNRFISIYEELYGPVGELKSR